MVTLHLVAAQPSYDLICVGGGPANLALTEELLAQAPRNFKTLIIDLGRPVADRNCPLAHRGICPPCKLCHAVHGIAGAGAYSDGKVSFWPAGSGILELAGSYDKVLRLDQRLRVYYSSLFTARSFSTCTADAAPLLERSNMHGIQLKPYDCTHGGSEAIQEFYKAKQTLLVERGVQFHTGARVSQIERHAKGGYFVEWQQAGKTFSAVARYVSLGVGKASGRWFRGILDRLGVQRDYGEIEAGVRIEFPYEVAEHIASCHRDAKLKLTAEDGSEVRTFCFCHRGFVLGAYYDDMTTVSGYSLRDKHSANTNFALLNRVRLPDGQDPYTSFLPHVQTQNLSANGGITVQLLGDFFEDRPSTPDALAQNLVRPTLPSAVPGQVTMCYTRTMKQNIVRGIHSLDLICPGLSNPRNLVYGPVLEKCWDRIRLNSMTTTAPGLFVVGDATGFARGLVQASATGLLAAEAILEGRN